MKDSGWFGRLICCLAGYLITSFSTYSQVLPQDSLALIGLFEATNGGNWIIPWDTINDPVGQWQGVAITADRVTGLNLSNNQLNGTINDLSALDQLASLDLSNNQLDGNVPTTLNGNLSNLLLLDLSNNQLSGTMPTQLGMLTNLITLILNNNQLVGTIPAAITNILNLQLLNLSSNKFVNEIPIDLDDLTDLVSLNLSNNLLDGTIPAEISALNELQILILNNNRLSGSIPDPLGNLDSLRTLNLSQNDLTGSIPVALAQLDSLRILDLSLNQLDGNVINELGNLTILESLDLSFNLFDGSIPVQLSQLSKLKTLSLRGNQLTGTVATEFGDLILLESVDFAQNMLADSLPDDFANLVNLNILDISENLFNHLPDLSSLGALISFQVDNNLLSFEDLEANFGLFSYSTDYSPQAPVDKTINIAIPIGGAKTFTVESGGSANLYRWKKDTIITVFNSDDNFSITNFQEGNAGSYTAEIINTIVPNLTLERNPINVSRAINQIDSLTLLNLYLNTDGPNWLVSWDTSTAVSQWFGISIDSGRVVGINLSNNQLKGAIPVDIDNLEKLNNLRLSLNQLEDSIPTELGQLEELNILTLDNNQLVGSVPQSLADLNNLSILYINDNQLNQLPPNFSNLDEFRIFNNFFTFGDIEPNLDASGELLYTPQLNIDQILDTIPQGDDLFLAITTDIGVTINSYNWVKNEIDTLGMDSVLVIPNVTFEDVAIYTNFVTNENVPNLVLEYSFDIQMSPIKPNVGLPPPYCSGDTLVSLSVDETAEFTIWYANEDLTFPLDTGQTINYSISQDRDTLYVTNKAGNLESEAEQIFLILRPTITEAGDTLIASTGGISYQWLFNGKLIAGAIGQIYVKNEEDNGFYNVRVITSEGCSATSINFGLVTSITIPTQREVRIYPNPVKNLLNLELNNIISDELQVQIVDLTGRIIYHEIFLNPSRHFVKSMDLRGTQSGLYLLKITGNGFSVSRRIVKN